MYTWLVRLLAKMFWLDVVVVFVDARSLPVVHGIGLQ